jgi:hypothetical protein
MRRAGLTTVVVTLLVASSPGVGDLTAGVKAKRGSRAAGTPRVATAPPVAPLDVAPNSAVAAPDWTALFHRSSGWTGADGIYSIPLSGDERPGTAGNTNTFWTFSDTFIGQVEPDGSRSPGSVLIHNTNALLTGGNPDPALITFYWNTDATRAPAPRVVPNTSPQQWFWPNDGIALGGNLYLYALRMKPGGSGAFSFAVDGISLLTDSLSDPTPFQTYTQVVTPLYVSAAGSKGEMYFGQAVTPNTAAAGAPFPDGYLYIYGVRNDPYDKKLVVARVLPTNIANFAQYTYWDGSRWNATISKAAPLTDRLSSEFSVTPLSDGRFLLVFQLDTLSATVAVRYGSSPTGPWGSLITIWTCPEAHMTPNSYTYNAKAHPHLSSPGSLLISYNVNTFSFAENLANADIYHPRFIRLPLQ